MQNYPVWILVGAICAAILIIPDLMKVRNVSKVIRVTDTVHTDEIKPLVKGYDAFGVLQKTVQVKTIQERQQKDKPAITYHGHSVKLENP